MSPQDVRAVRYRLGATFRRRRGGYLALAVLIGLLGGTAMASIAAARRTQSSYPTFLASTNPSDLTLSTYGTSGDPSATQYSPDLARRLARIPRVRRVESWVGAMVAPLEPNGAPNLLPAFNPLASVDGLYFDVDRATAVEGRMADPHRLDEFVTTPEGARLLGWHVGQIVPTGVYTPAQANAPGFGTPAVPPARRIEMKLVGLVLFNNGVVQDDADRLPINVVYTPEVARFVIDSGAANGTWFGLQLVHGDNDVPAVERAIIGALPRGSVYNFRVTSFGTAKVERTIRPEAIALGVFGVIAALAALAIAVQAISRQLRSDDDDLHVLRALGASTVMTEGDALVGVLGAVVLGAVLACAATVALSPLAPFGPIRQVYPARGISFDWTVLGAGLLVVLGGLGGVAWALARRGAPHRVIRRLAATPARSSRVVRAAAGTGLPAAGMVGVRFALEPGRGRTAVPVRSALSGTVLAVVIVVATLTFGSGLHTLVSRPALYGWNWSYALTSMYNIPPQARALLDHDPAVAAWSGYNDLNVQVNGQNVPVLLAESHPRVSPPVLAGHALDGPDQIVLGAATLARLHRHIGDTVVVTYGTPREVPFYIPPTRLVIAGTATLPAIAGASTLADHVSMGVGAIVPQAIAPAALQQAASNPDPTLNGPSLVFVRLHSSVDAAAGLADMNRIAAVANRAFGADPEAVGANVAVLPVQRPAEIVNYRSSGATTGLLAGGLAAGAIVALGLTLTASVRRRRRDLSLLKTLGFTQWQLASAVAWQASVAALVGVVLGVPLGIAAGRWLWTLFARTIYAVPQPTVPWSVALVAVGTIVLANLVAALPGRLAARTPAALVLRTE